MKIAEKQKRKEARKVLAQKELDDFKASLPMEEKRFVALFHFLEKVLLGLLPMGAIVTVRYSVM